MNTEVRALLADRDSADRDVAYRAFVDLMALAERPVDWAYDVWDSMVSDLAHKDGHRRAFATQMLARLAISDPEGRMLRDFPSIAAVMRDAKTVTARHTLQSIWRVGLAGPDRFAMVVDVLEQRFRECASEKNGAMVRTDVVAALGQLSKAKHDASLERVMDRLVATETDPKAQRKQRASWRQATA